jgi:glycosyltransferase involved in cell wall biosynthesis
MLKLLAVLNYYKPAYGFGGPVRSLSALCEAWAALGVDLKLLTTDADVAGRLDVPLETPVMVDGVEVYYYPLAKQALGSYFRSPALVAGFKKWLAWADFVHLDVLFSHAGPPMSALCSAANIPYTISLRGAMLPYALQRSQLKKRLYLALGGWNLLKKAAAVHCTDVAEEVQFKNLCPNVPTLTVANGLHLGRFSALPARGVTRTRLQIPPSAPVLLFLGRLHSKKRPEVAVAALAKATAAHLILAGADEENLGAALKAQAEALGCANRLHLVGLLEGEALLSTFADSDLLVMPSAPQSENFGMSGAEALAAGLPILTSTDVPIGQWAVKYGVGFTAIPELAPFAEAAAAALQDLALLRALGARGQVLVAEHFEISRVAGQMLTHYQNILSAHKKTGS